jgi:polyhydroxyalkanoate synthase
VPSSDAADQLIERVGRELDRSGRRVRNGLRYLLGADRPTVAASPKDVVWTNGKVELWRYRSEETRARPPLLIVHSLVTRSYVFDLTPSNSLVQFFLGRGFDVFVVSWGEPDILDADNDVATYTNVLLPDLIRATAEHAGASEVQLLGYCLGGLLSLLHVAGNPDTPVSALTTVAVPLEVGHMGAMGAMLQASRLDPAALFDESGNVPPATVRNAFRLLQPTADLVGIVNLVQFLWNDDYLAMHRAMSQWASDHIPLAGGCARDLATFADDHPSESGCFTVGGRVVDLRDVTVPLLNVVGETDELVPPAAAGQLLDLVGSPDREELRLRSGHLGLLLGRTAHKRNLPVIADWLERHGGADTTNTTPRGD